MAYYERNLPHWQEDGRAIFLTWRLYGSLPAGFVRQLTRLAEYRRRQFVVAEARLDRAATGPKWLSDSRIAACAEHAILRGAELGHYRLHAHVVMPNHVHLLIDPHVQLARVTQGIKGVSARDGNAVLGRAGLPFWQDESFDHWVRGGGQFERILEYIERNPVKARLVARPEEWRWSSAHRRNGEDREGMGGGAGVR